MQEKYEVCCGLFHGFDWAKWKTGAAQERLTLLPAAQEHIRARENGKDRLLRAVHELSRTFALAVPHEEALRVRDDVAFSRLWLRRWPNARPANGARKRSWTMPSGRSCPEPSRRCSSSC